MTLGQRIQEFRKQMGLSQEGLGEALGVSRQAVSKWEGDNGIPELDTLITMSRLFGITVGELLGVEKTEEMPSEDETVPGGEAEALLREALPQETEPTLKSTPRLPLERWALPAAAAVLAVLVAVLFSQIVSLRSTVRSLRSQVSSLEVQVSNSLNGLSGQIRSSIYDILEEQAELLNTFSWELVDADLEAQTATIRLKATMKEYPAGSQVQFLAGWVKMDDTQGESVSDWAEGPDFAAEMTLPLNYCTEVSIRVKDTSGNVREQFVEKLYDLHPDAFHLEAYNLLMPFAITVKSGGVARDTAKSEEAWVDVLSAYPELFQPEEAVISASVNGTEVFSEAMTITQEAAGSQTFRAAIPGTYCDLTLKEGDTLEITLRVTDSLGRTEVFTHGGTVEDGWLEEMPIETRAVWVE